jgi:hypothetical protein
MLLLLGAVSVKAKEFNAQEEVQEDRKKPAKINSKSNTDGSTLPPGGGWDEESYVFDSSERNQKKEVDSKN